MSGQMSMEQKLEAALTERDELIASYVAVKAERDELLTALDGDELLIQLLRERVEYVAARKAL